MRLTDLVVAVMLNYPSFPYDSITLAAFDAATAGLALWLRVSLTRGALRSRADHRTQRVRHHPHAFLASSSAWSLAPRFEPAPGATSEPGLRKQSRPADQQHVRCGAVRTCPVHLRGGHHRGTHSQTPATGTTAASAAGPAAGQPDQAHQAASGTAPGSHPHPSRCGPPPPSEASTTQFRAAPSRPARCAHLRAVPAEPGRRGSSGRAKPPGPCARSRSSGRRTLSPSLTRLTATARTRIRAIRRSVRRPPGNPAPRRPEQGRPRCGGHRRCGTAR